MRHAVLGAGAVGGLIAGAMSAIGDQVLLILRSGIVQTYPQEISVSTPYGMTTGAVQIADRLTHAVDVLWIATKAAQLEQALSRIEVSDPARLIVPLLNGVDHVVRLRNSYGDAVCPATIFVESEKIGPGKIVQKSPLRRLSISGKGIGVQDLADRLEKAGLPCQIRDDETTMMWEKLCFLAPFALTTSAADKSCGEILKSPEWAGLLRQAIKEACTVANAEGAQVFEEGVAAIFRSLPATMRSSMQKDLAIGIVPELDAIAGPIIRGSQKYQTDSSARRQLVQAIEVRLTEIRRRLAER